ncbi:MAG: ABC transporter permease, partial [Polyangiaceae bacterium]|nr:ABC transporter permease [Polyangiaceae bacterium]
MRRDAHTAVVTAATGLAWAWLAFAVLVWVYGESPRDTIARVIAGTWGMAYGAGQVLYKATPLILTGAAVDVGLKAGVFNVGAEGQLAVAGLVAGWVGASLPANAPAGVAAPAAVLAAVLAGALWAAPPAWLRARFGAHEVISTIMMNRVADAVIGLALARGIGLPGTTRTADVAPGARLPGLSTLGLRWLHGSAVSVALPLAILTSLALSAWLARARIGREIVLVGLGPDACAAEGIPVARRMATALVFSGAIAGLAAIAPVLGYKGYFETGLGAGAGFTGIAVALLGHGQPAGLLFAALLFGTLEQGGLAINAYVPMEAMRVIEGVVILAVALS